MNLDKHFDRVSRQNLKFQFEFEYCAPFWANQCSCAAYVDGWCFKIEKFMLSAMSRWYLGPWCVGLGFALLGWCFGASRWCLGLVFIMLCWCLGDVSKTFGRCLGDVWVMSRSCLGSVSVLSWSCLCLVSVMSRSCLGLFLVMPRCYFGVVLLAIWWYFGDRSVWYVGDVSGMFLRSLRDVWWWCCDVLMMSGWCLVLCRCHPPQEIRPY